MELSKSARAALMLVLALLLCILPGRPAAAQYYMQLTDLDVYEEANSTSGSGVRDGAEHHRYGTGRVDPEVARRATAE